MRSAVGLPVGASTFAGRLLFAFRERKAIAQQKMQDDSGNIEEVVLVNRPLYLERKKRLLRTRLLYLSLV